MGVRGDEGSGELLDVRSVCVDGANSCSYRVREMWVTLSHEGVIRKMMLQRRGVNSDVVSWYRSE